jgi:hypothetical protein
VHFRQVRIPGYGSIIGALYSVTLPDAGTALDPNLSSGMDVGPEEEKSHINNGFEVPERGKLVLLRHASFNSFCAILFYD